MCSTVREALTAAAARIDLRTLTQAQAVQLVEEAAGIERLAAAVKASAGVRVAEGAAWRANGSRSPEEWFARTTGTSPGRARDVLDTARRLAELPEVAAAARSGRLSPEQTSEVASAASADPSVQAHLVAVAQREPFKTLKDRCHQVRNRGADAERRHQRAHAQRHLRSWTDRDGVSHLQVGTTVELLAELHARLAPHTKTVFDRARVEGRRESAEVYAHDALFDLLRTTGTREGVKPPVQTVILVDHAALTRGWTEDGETCEIAGIGPVPVSVARTALGDCLLTAVIRHGTDIRTVAHLGRSATTAQRTALALRDPCCVVPGCTTRTGLEIDHTTSATGWADTKRTTLDELARLCHTHHHAKTHQGWTLTGPPGHWRWHPPMPGGAGAGPRRDRHPPCGTRTTRL